MKKHIGYFLAGAGCLLSVLSAIALTARSSAAGDDAGARGHGFSNRSIKGNWGFTTEVSVLLPPVVPEPMPTTSVGRISFDGKGGCSTSFTNNNNGDTMVFNSSSCTYSVNADGTGTSEVVFRDAPITDPIPFAWVIVKGGREILFMYTKFIVGTFTAKRQ